MNKRYCASLALIAGLLAGCSGEDPSGTQTVNGTSTPSSQPPVDGTVPEAARANTCEGAEAFVEFYLATYNSTAVNGSAPHALADISDPSCQTCSGWIEQLTEMADTNQHATRDPVVAVIAEAVPLPEPAGAMGVPLTVSGPLYEIVNNKNVADRTVEPLAPFAAQAHVRWDNGSWKMLRIAQEETSR